MKKALDFITASDPRDEISFKESEFTGLTEEDAHTLFQRKDRSYLRS